LCVLSWAGAGEELRMGREEGGFYILLLWSIAGIRFRGNRGWSCGQSIVPCLPPLDYTHLLSYHSLIHQLSRDPSPIALGLCSLIGLLRFMSCPTTKLPLLTLFLNAFNSNSTSPIYTIGL